MKVLFVCLGNICRSPTAEGVFKAVVEKSGLSSAIEIDSAGTSGCHIGQRADSRMRQHASARGYDLLSRSRKFDQNIDFTYFDKIIVMDSSNKRDITELDLKGEFSSKIKMMTDYCTAHKEKLVPDPYYGGAAGFENVIDIIEDASEGLLNEIKKIL